MAKNINNLDKSLKQNITPADIGAATSSSVTTVSNNIGALSNLKTSEKGSLVGAINELFQSANNGKQLIANAIGEPLSSNDTFSAMSNDINSLLSTFKTNMMNNGVTVESNDKFKQLIDKIATMVEEGSNKGVHYYRGNVPNIKVGLNNRTGSIVIKMDLDFTPTFIWLAPSYNTLIQSERHYSRKTATNVGAYFWITDITNTSFTLNYEYANNSLTYTVAEYIAIGVGEEDTTLRDSLASILQEEGVSVTEEDDMASLIGKVDEEFDENRNKLYNLMLNGGYEVNSSMNMDNLLELLSLSGISSSDIKQIACGDYHAFILKNDGSLWSCGYNYYGQLGLNNTTDKKTFIQVTTNINNDVKQIACGGNHTFILKNDGSLWSCGYNDRGQLGLNNNTQRNTFTQVTTNVNNDVKQIACGYSHTFILKNDGTLWACGVNEYGQLGLNNSTNKKTFTQVTTNINNDVKQIACGYEYTFILKNDGSVWGCGRNNYGDLGLGNTTNKTSFTQVTTNINNDVKQIACGGYHTFILKNDGTLWSCGFNGNGQLGLKNSTNKTIFTQVTTNINNDIKEVVCGTYHTFILKNDGSVWACGLNGNGQLGLNNITDKTSFTQVTININNDVKQIASGRYYSFILKNDGSVWSCGLNEKGQLGLSDTTNKTSFTMIPRGLY